MRLTTKGRFAVTAMIDLALRSNNGPVALAAISQRQQISLSYLEQLFGKLRRRNLVSSVRGPGGGYRLAQPMQGITVAAIVIAVDEPLDATQCGGKENCADDKRWARTSGEAVIKTRRTPSSPASAMPAAWATMTTSPWRAVSRTTARISCR